MSAIVCVSVLLLLVAGSLAQAQGPRVGEPPIEGTPSPPGEKPLQERPRRQERGLLPGPREMGAAGAPAHDFDVLLWGDDFESGTYDDWSWDGLWHPITDTHPSGYGNSYSPVTSFWYGQNATGNYDTPGTANSGFLSLTTPISLPSSLPNAGLSFWNWEETESEGGYFDYDIRSVEVATDPVSPTWTTIWSTEITNTIEGVWYLVELDLTPCIGNDILLRFEFDTVDDQWNDYGGWYVDDVAVGYDFQPSVEVEKTGDALSKSGDEVTYTYTITNTSSIDTPNLSLVSVIDDKVGNITAAAAGATPSCSNLGPGDSCSFDVNLTIPSTTEDPYLNRVDVIYTVNGLGNEVSAWDTHSVNLFQAEIALEKTGDELSKIGDLVDYTITLYNNSSADTPDMECTITDAPLGVSDFVTLASGASHVVKVYDFEIPADATDPYVNTARVLCSPIGFLNEYDDEASHEVNLFQEHYIYLPLILKNY